MRVQGSTEKQFLETVVARNVDQGPLVYDLFEEKHHVLESLTKRQIELIVPSRPSRILVIGCGTGISAMTICNMLASSDRQTRIFAIDVSEQMLSKAKERYRNIPGLYFIRGDADNLESFFHEGFDGIFYTPSIFHIPNFRESVRQSSGLLVPEGVISICDFAGLFDDKGDDAVQKAFPDFRHHPGVISSLETDSYFASMKEFRTTWVDFRMEASTDFLFDYLSIPSQSSALFPKLPYLDRIPKIREICATLEEKSGPVFMGWKFCMARKGQRLAS